jgi:hypothetical protein
LTTANPDSIGPVSRAEIAGAVRGAFDGRPASVADMLEAARAVHARPEAIHLLERLPVTHFRSIRELWQHLPELPVK